MPTTAEYRRLSAILREMERRESQPLPEETESQEFASLRSKEAASLEKFFEKKISVPQLPPEVTADKVKRWESMGLKLHFLPEEDMKDKTHLKNWKKQPDYKTYVDATKLPADVMTLKGGWVLVDTRQKPEYANGDQMYQNDFLAPVLEALNKQGVIKQRKTDGTALDPKSRFGLSPEELEKPEVIAAFAKAYGVKPEQITIQREIEFNVLGNMYHPEWGEAPSNCSEWFGDPYDAGLRRLYGGRSDSGGLPYVNWFTRASRSDHLGFRVLVRFSR